MKVIKFWLETPSLHLPQQGDASQQSGRVRQVLVGLLRKDHEVLDCDQAIFVT